MAGRGREGVINFAAGPAALPIEVMAIHHLAASVIIVFDIGTAGGPGGNSQLQWHGYWSYG